MKDIKKVFWESIASTIVSVLGTSLLSFCISLPFMNKGNIRIGDIYKTDEIHLYRNIEVVNYSSDYLNELILKIPNTCSIENECFITTLQINKKATDMNDYYLYSLDMIEPKTSSLITIEVKNTDNISFPNYKSKRFLLTVGTKIESPYLKLLKSLVPTFCVYFVLLLGFQFFMNKKLNELDIEIENNKKDRDLEIEKIETKLKNSQDETQKIENKMNGYVKDVNLKMIFFKKQLNDYEKELDFWRNTVRQVLFKGDKKHTQAEKLFEAVTEQLKTYTVKSKKNLDLDEILFVADEINKREK